MKVHLFRSSRSTWCGRDERSYDIKIVRDRRQATCLVCLKADVAEQSKEDEASQAGLRDEGDAL
jgi:hypothetical protein